MRRVIEAGALAVLLPGLLGVQWYDANHTNGPGEQTTTLRHGATVTLGHARWRLLGRVADSEKAETPGALPIKLLLQVQPLDALGVKQADPLDYEFRLRDRAGHTWDATGDMADDVKPVIGRPSQMNITAEVPARLVGSVVLEMKPGLLVKPQSTRWFRFAH